MPLCDRQQMHDTSAPTDANTLEACRPPDGGQRTADVRQVRHGKPPPSRTGEGPDRPHRGLACRQMQLGQQQT